MADRGYLKLYRSTFNHWVCDDKPFDEFHAWVDLIQLANFAGGRTTYRGEVVERRRGDVNRSKKNLSLRWGWSYNRVTRFLNKLQDDGMIVLKASKRKTVITICNYSRYQDNTRSELLPSPTLKASKESIPISLEQITAEIEAKNYRFVKASQFLEYYEDHGGLPKTWKRVLAGWERRAKEKDDSIPHPYGRRESQFSKEDVQAALAAFEQGE